MPLQFTNLLPNDVLNRAERMRVNPARRRTNRQRGEHLSGRGGTSIEFADYRDYVPGDDLRDVDWNIFGRLNQPYLKLRAQEEELHVVLMVDASTSMRFEGKFDLARQVAAALGTMGLMGGERVSVYSCASKQTNPEILPARSGRPAMRRFFKFLEDLTCGGDLPVDQAVDKVLRRHRGLGIVYVLSDFLSQADFSTSFNKLNSAGLEIAVVQILAPSEIDPQLNGDLRFVDSEDQDILDVSSVGELLNIYQDHRLALEDRLATNCRKRNGRFLALSSQTPIKEVLFEKMLRYGRIR